MNRYDWETIPIPRNLSEFYYGYELPLARAFYQIERRGVFTDAAKMDELRGFLLVSLEDVALKLSEEIHKHVAFSKTHAERMGWDRKDYINLSYPKDVAALLESKPGIKLPINRITGNKTTDEEALNQIYADTGDPTCLDVLYAREYTKILGTYVNALLHGGVLYSTYVVTGTVNGRRSSRKNIFGYGTNHQNIPKHSELGKRFRNCIIARPGKILIGGDQAQAEDWVVNAIIADIGGDFRGLNELRRGIDRHRALASFLFNKPESACGKNSPERFMGKKTRHAGNYDMGPDEFARQLVKEGHTGMPPGLCGFLLGKFHEHDPGIRGVFHKYVQDQISETRMLRTPIGRERLFLGARPFSNNAKVFKEAYSFVPQGTVGDNTGLGILYCERNDPGLVIMDGHDAVVLEVVDNIESVVRGVNLLEECFNRKFTFPNGLEIQIPVEFDMGYSLGEMEDFKSTDESVIKNIYEKCQGKKETVSATCN